VRLCRWERVNAYQLRRDADLLGAVKSDEKKDVEKKADAKNEDAAVEVDPVTGEVVTKKDGEKKDELPPLEQPDENNRPKEDPQMDTAMLVIRLKLLGQKFPSIAAAEIEAAPKSAQP